MNVFVYFKIVTSQWSQWRNTLPSNNYNYVETIHFNIWTAPTVIRRVVNNATQMIHFRPPQSPACSPSKHTEFARHRISRHHNHNNETILKKQQKHTVISTFNFNIWVIRYEDLKSQNPLHRFQNRSQKLNESDKSDTLPTARRSLTGTSIPRMWNAHKTNSDSNDPSPAITATLSVLGNNMLPWFRVPYPHQTCGTFIRLRPNKINESHQHYAPSKT